MLLDDTYCIHIGRLHRVSKNVHAVFVITNNCRPNSGVDKGVGHRWWG